jgi:hypothetical protein
MCSLDSTELFGEEAKNSEFDTDQPTYFYGILTINLVGIQKALSAKGKKLLLEELECRAATNGVALSAANHSKTQVHIGIVCQKRMYVRYLCDGEHSFDSLQWLNNELHKTLLLMAL